MPREELKNKMEIKKVEIPPFERTNSCHILLSGKYYSFSLTKIDNIKAEIKT